MSTLKQNRREFLKGMAAAAAAMTWGPALAAPAADKGVMPAYLKGYEALYAKDPRAAALAWFKDAKYGLFMHYGLYSLLGRGEWVMHNQKIPVAEYSKIKDRFTAAKFDADFITDLALEARMKYVNITTRHHDGFCLFKTRATDFHSVNSPAGRDLIGELAEQCGKKGLGLFLYYSYGMDWRMPEFDLKDPAKMAQYMAFCQEQIRELLTNYGPIAGMWFDYVSTTYANPEMFEIEKTYALIRKLQPQTLISFKQGINGDEDYASCERRLETLATRPAIMKAGSAAVARAVRAWTLNQKKYNEINTTLQPGVWAWNESDNGKHRTPDEVMVLLAEAFGQNSNLLLNTGPLPDGSIPAEDVATLKEVGRRIRERGWPAPKAPGRQARPEGNDPAVTAH